MSPTRMYLTVDYFIFADNEYIFMRIYFYHFYI